MPDYQFGFDTEEYDDSILSTIPKHILRSIEAYTQTGRPVGDFLRAVISNDLREG